MKPVKDMSADELVGEAAASDPGAYDQNKRNEVLAEIRDRLHKLQTIEDEAEDTRAKLVEQFAHSATTAVVGLWMAHGGRPVESDETPDLAKCLFEFFSKIR